MSRRVEVGLLYSIVPIMFLFIISLLGDGTSADTNLIAGDWNIDSDVILQNGTWEVSGSVTISNGTLSLENAILVVNSSSAYRSYILVTAFGHLIARNSTICGNNFGVCIEVHDDTYLDNTTIHTMDRRNLGYGLFHMNGSLGLENCRLRDGLNHIYSCSNLSIRSCLFLDFDDNAVYWDYRDDVTARRMVVDLTVFRNADTKGTAVLLYGSYTRRPGWDAIVRRCEFTNLTYGIWVNGYEDHGSLLVEGNTAHGCKNGLVLFWVGSVATIRYNEWYMPLGGTGLLLQLRGDNSPNIHNETITGGKYGVVINGEHQHLRINNVTIQDTVVNGVACYLVYLDIYDSSIETTGFNFYLRGPTHIHIYDCVTDHTGVVTGDGEIRELTRINITAVTWQEGTPIEEGSVTFETEKGFQVVTYDIAPPSAVEFPLWLVRQNLVLFIDTLRGGYMQDGEPFHSRPFPVGGTESMTLVIYDDFIPVLKVECPSDGAKLREGGLVANGTFVEKGAGMGTVMVRSQGRDWAEASLSEDAGWSLVLAGLQDGVLNLSVRIQDRAGNSMSVDIGNITIDTIIPTIEVMGPPRLVRRTPVELVAGTEPGSRASINYRFVEVSTDGMFSALVPLQEGENRILIFVEDRVGNSNATTYVVFLDTIAPPLSLSSPVEGVWTREVIVWTNGTTEPDAIVNVNGEPADVAIGSFSVPLALGEGDSTIVVTATDLAGNVATMTRTVRVDRTPPSLGILEPGDGHITSERALTVVGNVVDEAPVSVLVQGFPAAMVGTEWFKEVLISEGSNRIETIAIDAAGNVATKYIEVILDTRPPSLEIMVTIGGRSYRTDGGVIVTNLTEARFDIYVDEIGTVEVAGRTNLTMDTTHITRTFHLEEGTNRFIFIMRDDAGNRANPFSCTIERDTIAPEITITSPVDGLVTWDDQIMVKGVTEADVIISIEGAMPILYLNGSYEAVVPLSMGTNHIRVRVTDAANNTAVAGVDIVRRERDDLKPIDGGTDVLVWSLGLIVGCSVSIAILFTVFRRGREGTADPGRDLETIPRVSNAPSIQDDAPSNGDSEGTER